MLQCGLKAIAKDQNDPDSPLLERVNGSDFAPNEVIAPSISIQPQNKNNTESTTLGMLSVFFFFFFFSFL